MVSSARNRKEKSIKVKRIIESIKWFFGIGWELVDYYLGDEMWSTVYVYRNKTTGEIRKVIEN